MNVPAAGRWRRPPLMTGATLGKPNLPIFLIEVAEVGI